MKKKIFLLTGLLFLLGSCSNDFPSYQTMVYNDTFSSDLRDLFDFDDTEALYQEGFPFLVNCNVQKSETYQDFFILSVDIAYKETEINNIKIIILPFDLSFEDKPSSIANVGYNEVFNLTEKLNVSTNSFKGYRISFLAKDYDSGVKVSVIGKINNEEKKYLFYLPQENFPSDFNN